MEPQRIVPERDAKRPTASPMEFGRIVAERDAEMDEAKEGSS